MSEAKILEHDPLTDAEKILRDDFYGKSQTAKVSPLAVTPSEPTELISSTNRKRTKPKVKPTHYKVVCI